MHRPGSSSLVLLPQKALTLCGENHTKPRARMSLWMRSADGRGPSDVKDALMPQSVMSGTWTPGSRRHLPALWVQLKVSVISQVFLCQWRHCSQNSWVPEHQLCCARRGCFPCFPHEQPHWELSFISAGWLLWGETEGATEDKVTPSTVEILKHCTVQYKGSSWEGFILQRRSYHLKTGFRALWLVSFKLAPYMSESHSRNRNKLFLIAKICSFLSFSQWN